MADSSISNFLVQKTDVPDGSYLGFSWFDGTTHHTVKILAEDFAAALGTPNFANSNLTADADRSHDMNSHDLIIGKIKELTFETTVAPSTGNPAIKIKGYGNTGSDLVLNATCPAGDILQLFGDKLASFKGKVYVNTTGVTGGLFQMEVISSTNGIISGAVGTAVAASSSGGTAMTVTGAVKGVQASSVNGIGVEASTSGTGTALNAKTNTGTSVRVEGHSIFEEYGASSSGDASALVEINSTSKGFLVPRMTTLQKEAIPSPATSLFVYDSTRERHEYYNGTYWRGLTMRFLPIQFSSWSPTDAQTVAFGSHPFIPVLASIGPAPFEIVMRGNGVIRGCDFDTYASGVGGTNEAWSLYVRHNGTDYLVQTVSAAAAIRKFSNQLLSIPFVDGDIVRMIFVNPTWATNPTNVAASGSLNIQ